MGEELKMIDLHIHTHYSDGKMSPKELLELYNSKGFKVISFADHDSIRAYEDLKSLKVPKGIRVILGVELTLEEKGYEFHILSYGFKIDEDKRKFLKLIEERKRNGTANRIKQINEKLRINGLNEVDEEELMSERIHHSYQIANSIMHRNDIPYDKSYREFVAPIRSITSRNLPSVREARQAGFENLILAHPFSKYHSLEEYCNNAQERYNEVLTYLFGSGLSGIEIYSPRHSVEQISLLESEAQKNSCLVTCGSDFHKPEDLDKYIAQLSTCKGNMKSQSLIENMGGIK